MNVLMTTDVAGGVWTYTLELAHALALEGVPVTLATLGGRLSRAQRAAALRLPHVALRESEYRLEWMPDPWADVQRSGEWLLEVERCVQPDVVHLNQYAYGALPWRAPVVAVVGHSCVLSWWEAVKGECAPAQYDRYREAVTRGLHAAGLVIAPTRAMLHALHQHYGPLPGSRVIHNARSPQRFAPGTKRPIIFFAGRLWDEAKNAGVLERIARRVAWPVIAAGDTHHPDGRDARPKGLCLLGPLDPGLLARWYAIASIYVCPARYEPFGLPALEAALAGCALVLSDLPSLREVWGEAALYVPPDDAEAWAAALSGLIARPEHWRKLAARARERALQFNPQTMAREYLRAYREARERPRLKHAVAEPVFRQHQPVSV